MVKHKIDTRTNGIAVDAAASKLRPVEQTLRLFVIAACKKHIGKKNSEAVADAAATGLRVFMKANEVLATLAGLGNFFRTKKPIPDGSKVSPTDVAATFKFTRDIDSDEGATPAPA